MKVGKSYLALIAALGMLTAACGGGGEGGPTDGGLTTSTAGGSGSVAETTTTEGTTQSSPGGEGESLAVVTIDGTPFEFRKVGPAATCNPDFFGGFFSVLYSEDLGSVFEIELWNEGSGDGAQVSSARMTATIDGVEMDLEADPEGSWPGVEEGTSFVESFSYEDNSAQGTISFIDTEVAYNADLFPLDPVIAQFEITCGDD
jgi:hypothetical protein